MTKVLSKKVCLIFVVGGIMVTAVITINRNLWATDFNEVTAIFQSLPVVVIEAENEYNVPPLVDLEDFFNFGNSQKVECDFMVRTSPPDEYSSSLLDARVNASFRSTSEIENGTKMVCLDDRLGMVSGDCTVLSLGIDNGWSFDDEMAKYGCNVYVFDPSISKDSYNRSPLIHVYKLGISDYQWKMDDLRENWPRIVKVDKYEDIIYKLGLTDVDINYLKMDIAGAELTFLEDVQNSRYLLERVKQIGMDIHPGIPPIILSEEGLKESLFWNYWQVMHKLQYFGFRIVYYEMKNWNHAQYKWKNREEATSYEVVWVREEGWLW